MADLFKLGFQWCPINPVAIALEPFLFEQSRFESRAVLL